MSKILVADDMAICREPIAEVLRRQGFETLIASDGTMALTVIREQKPDLILLDVNMPGLDGFAVLRTVRRNPDLKDIPIIMLTEKGGREVVIEAAKFGVQGYLLKSQFTLEDLLTRVNSCLGNRATAAVSAHAPAAAPARVAAPSPAPEPAAVRSNYSRWRQSETQAGEAVATNPAPNHQSQRTERAAPPSSSPTPQSAPVAPSVPVALRSLEDLTPGITKEDLVRLVNKGLELRPLGPTVQNVIAVTSSAGCNADDVSHAVANDQALSIRLLRLANSSAYSRGHLVNGVKDAVQRIGVKEVRSLVMALGVFEQFDKLVSERIDPRLFWEHSIACGFAAAGIARCRQSKRIDDCYLWGMMHDVGRLVLLEHVTAPYMTVWAAADELRVPLEVVEPKLMLMDHCDILERALEHWQFPRDFIVPVVSHHRSPGTLKGLGPAHRESAAMVALADRLAHALLLGSSGNEIIYPLDDLVELVGISAKELTAVAESVRDETHDLKFTMLARANQENWPDYVELLRAKCPKSLRFLNAGVEPESDAFRLFCQRVGSADAAPPNVGVLYLRNVSELDRVANLFDAEETKAGCSARLPVIVICHRGKVDAEAPSLRGRAHALLSTPVRVDTLLDAARQFVS